MQQMEIPEQQIVPIDYTSSLLPVEVRQFRPVLFEEDDHFCCVLGPDMETAVVGRGATEDEAIDKWTEDCRLRLQSSNGEDQVLQYMKDLLSVSKYDIN